MHITNRTVPDTIESAENEDDKKWRRRRQRSKQLSSSPYPYLCDLAHPLHCNSGQ